MVHFKPQPICGELSSRHEITWRDSAPFNSPAAAIRIRRTTGAVGIPGTVGILDRVRRIRRAVATIGVAGRVRIIRVRAQLAPVLTLLIVEPWGVCGEGIRHCLIAVGAAVGTEGIVDAPRLEGAAGSERIGRGIRIVRTRAQLAEIFRSSRSWTEEKEKEKPHVEPLSLASA